MKTSAILLAGGIGSRMQSEHPKQYLPLAGKPLALHSFEVLLASPQINEIIVVCAPAYRHHFTGPKTIKFALPGNRRQDSVFHGFKQISEDSDLVCIHDSARPFITVPMVEEAILAASIHGAAVTAMPLKFTIKETDSRGFVKGTPDRSNFWEIQTPQIARPDLIRQGFALADAQGLTVTDDASLVELIPHPVKIIEGSHTNIKITTPDDLKFAEWLLRENALYQPLVKISHFGLRESTRG